MSDGKTGPPVFLFVLPQKSVPAALNGLNGASLAYVVESVPTRGKEENVHEHIRRRCLMLGELLLETGSTVRALARTTGYSKSTVHKDLTERLPDVNGELAKEVARVLAYHKAVRHLRGGEATRRKWRSGPAGPTGLSAETD
ncbi:sporulation transcriptional regulator SpoIIID [Edaphobacillus lindanitolerans]|uniref:Sporulation transcriptional regulator SpoIIID n=1 Tax=Edaphobacillus lindanitolerans TaxID=550447 RepID=A0A1U7PMD3_9BACI|nr:sporulation transcriptional regulator SpoIIID [Edaphobacillus lindanitolerans]